MSRLVGGLRPATRSERSITLQAASPIACLNACCSGVAEVVPDGLRAILSMVEIH